jgi:mRNA-degrading endonuclease RelE of RelBE toxin-antitoxin system
MYQFEFDDEWHKRIAKLDKSIRTRVLKKAAQIINGLPGRHLQHGTDYFVEEVGQYRIAYKSFEREKMRRFYFVGTHKEYLKWLGIE